MKYSRPRLRDEALVPAADGHVPRRGVSLPPPASGVGVVDGAAASSKVARRSDPLEREAEAVADRVTSGQARLLPSGLRSGRDLGDVRIHTGPEAARAAEGMNARAFTSGRDIVFNAGEYRPDTVGGRRLLAHELTHVAQHEAGETSPGTVYREPKDEEEAGSDASTATKAAPKKKTKPDPTSQVIAIQVAGSRCVLYFGSGEIRTGSATVIGLPPGNYELEPEPANRKWIIHRTQFGPQFKEGLRFYLIPEVKDLWGLNFAERMPLTMGGGGFFPKADFNLSVDQFAQVYYDIDYQSEDGNLSKWLVLIYPDGTAVDIHLDQIGDETMTDATTQIVRDYGSFGPGNRVYPRVMNKSSTPRLWAAKQQALKAMGDYNLEFMMGTFPTVFFVITISPTANPVGVSTGKLTGSRSRVPGKFNRGRYGKPPGGHGKGPGGPGGKKPGGGGQGPPSSGPTPGASKAAKKALEQIQKEGGEVVVNLGGTGESPGAINVNPGASSMPKDTSKIPHFVKAPARYLGKLLPKGSVDRIVSYNVEPGRIDWNATAKGAKHVMKPGKEVYVVQYGGSQVDEIAEAFRSQGFDVNVPVRKDGTPIGSVIATSPK